MKKQDLILLVGLFFMLLTSSVGYAQKITLAYVDFPPYEYQENNEPKGVLVEIVKTLFERANIPLDLQYLPFKRAYQDTLDGKIAGLFNFYKTAERLPLFDYSEPIIMNPLVFFVKKDSALQFNTLEDLKGLRIGAMVGYTYGEEFDNTTLFTIDRVSSHEINFRKLAAGRLDAYPCDKLVGSYVAQKENVLAALKILPNPLKVMEGHIGFQKGRHPEVLAKINAVLEQMKAKGEIEQMITTYLQQLQAK